MGRWLDRVKEPERRKGQGTGPRLEPGCLIHWRGLDGTTRGPALLRGTFQDQGQVWAWFTLGGIEYLIRAELIVTVHGPEEL